jgi:uncharacterized protein (TIGR00661 family)
MKTVLVCPLDWGLGHASRCVPIIQEFLNAGAKVIIGADKRPLAFLRNEFPELEWVEFPGFDILYPENGSMILKMMGSVPRILKGIRKENALLKKIISEKNIDIVVSDNRFGLWNKKVKTVFITHQVMIKCPSFLGFIEYFLYRTNLKYIKKFDECWIPDFDKKINLSGDLSHKYKCIPESFFIGPLSRFNGKPLINHKDEDTEYDVIFILSGPEPQRTIFEHIIIDQLNRAKQLNALIVRGLTEEENTPSYGNNHEIYSHLPTDELLDKINKSKVVICRSGYSSIMDFASLGKKAILVPTPGQTEQEYLADFFKKQNIYYSEKQKHFNLMRALSRSSFYLGLKANSDHSILIERIKKLLEIS